MKNFIEIINEASANLNVLNLRSGFVINPKVTNALITHQQNIGTQQDIYDSVISLGRNSPVAMWFSTTLLNALIRHLSDRGDNYAMYLKLDEYIDFYLDTVPEEQDSRTAQEILDELPTWAIDGIIFFPLGFDSFFDMAADGVYTITDHNNTQSVEINFHELLDFITYYDSTGKNLNRLSVPEAVRMSTEWHSNSQSEIGSDTGKKVMGFPDGYAIIQLTTEKQLDYESKHCDHCIGKGGYDRELKKEDGLKIFSLRDPDNIPIVSISVNPDNRTIEQMQSFKNNPPPEDVYDHLKSFMLAAHLRFRSAEQAKRNLKIEADIDF